MSLLLRYYPGNYSEEHFNLEKRIGWYSFFLSFAFVAMLWLIKLVEFEYSLDFTEWGIYPRVQSGLFGILLSPLVHADFGHLAANTMPVFVLTFSLFFFYRKSSFLIFILIYLFSGLFVWLGGREAWHIGASGLIYGLAAFLFLSGVLSHNISLLTISMIVALFYGGLFWGIFPIKPEISWEAHLWGGFSGFGLAVIFRMPAQTSEAISVEEDDDPDDTEWKELQEDFEETISEEKENL